MSEKEYIERGALLEMMRERIGVLEKQHGCLDRYVKGYIEGAIYVDVAPAADVVDVRHGTWTFNKDGSGTCNQCGTTQKNVWDYDNWQNYCGHCGARMDGERKDKDDG